jgi:hypothetical protein
MRPSLLIAAGVLSALAVTGCYHNDPPPPTILLTGTAVAGPVCPVEQDPPDPGCAPRPVEGAPIFVQPADGRDIMIAQGTTDADGVVVLRVPPGDYVVSGGDVSGLMGLPEPTAVSVDAGATSTLDLGYDTGIR